MKKSICLLMIAALAATTVMAGCNKEQKPDEGSAAPEVEAVDGGLSAEAEPMEELELPELKEFEYSALDYVDLGEYKDMEVEVDAQYEANQENLVATINDELTYHPQKIEEGEIQDGDTANIDYVGTVDGEEFAGGSAEGYDLTIGSHTFIDGFEDQLIGAKVGDTVEVNVTFPEQYGSAELAGQDAVFTVTVNAISVPITYDELTDEFVSDNLGFDTIKEYEASIQEELETKQKEAISNAVAQRVIEGSKVNGFPEGLIEQNCEVYKYQEKAMAQQYGYTFNDLLQMYGLTEEEFDAQIETMMTQNVSQELVLQAVAETEGLEIDEADYDDYVKNLALGYGVTDPQEIYDQFTESYVRSVYLCSVVVADYLAENNSATFVDKSVADIDVDDLSVTAE